MLMFSLWLGCAPKQNGITEAISLEHKQILETIDLSAEFGSEFTGWYYHLSLQEIQSGTDVRLPVYSGWAAFNVSGQQLLGTGFYPSINPETLCSSGCQILNAFVSQSETVGILPKQGNQDLSESAPSKSNGLTMIETWSEPLKDVGLGEKALRLRAVHLEPKGNVGQHKHQGRPSFAYVLSGKLIEHRGDGDESYSHGEPVAERNGLVHWWENGDSEATIVVFDIIDSE